MRAELPGIDPEKDANWAEVTTPKLRPPPRSAHVEITVDAGLMTIAAHGRSDKTEKSGNGYRTEFYYGRLGCRGGSVPMPSRPPTATPSTRLLVRFRHPDLQHTVVVSLFDEDVGIYALHKSGHLYDLGFKRSAIISLSGIFGGREVSRRSRDRLRRSTVE